MGGTRFAKSVFKRKKIKRIGIEEKCDSVIKPSTVLLYLKGISRGLWCHIM